MPDLRVELVAWTEFSTPFSVRNQGWENADADGADALAEFAGRACYQSWHRPNALTATNGGYLRHILDVQHLSVLEHGSATFYVTGVSRALTHELVRHRHLSYSQLSQRYVDASTVEFVEPPLLASDVDAHDAFVGVTDVTRELYGVIADRLGALLADEPNRTRRRKLTRQAARYVLPNATETKIVVTGNHRAWREFLLLRGTEHADVEIHDLALALLDELREVAPNCYQDLEVVVPDDGLPIIRRTDA